MLIFFLDKPMGEWGKLVTCRVPIEGNERFPLMEGTDRFRVRGKIEKVEILTIDLKDVSIEQVH
jgi:hypothetical protein